MGHHWSQPLSQPNYSRFLLVQVRTVKSNVEELSQYFRKIEFFRVTVSNQNSDKRPTCLFVYKNNGRTQ